MEVLCGKPMKYVNLPVLNGISHELRLNLEAYYRSIGMGVSVESTDANYIGTVEAAKRMPMVIEE
jgi:ethanolamine utilization microcompartment shell protein EutL